MDRGKTYSRDKGDMEPFYFYEGRFVACAGIENPYNISD